jgi:hypothetical protein
MNDIKTICCFLLLFIVISDYSKAYGQLNGSSDPFSKKEQITSPQKGWYKLNTNRYAGKQDDITFINEKEGWYVNGFGSIYHTKDGGESWEKLLEKKGTFFRCIAFIDSLTGFAGTVGTDYFPNVTDTIPLYGTIDGGKTWNPVSYAGPYVKGLCIILPKIQTRGLVNFFS